MSKKRLQVNGGFQGGPFEKFVHNLDTNFGENNKAIIETKITNGIFLKQEMAASNLFQRTKKGNYIYTPKDILVVLEHIDGGPDTEISYSEKVHENSEKNQSRNVAFEGMLLKTMKTQTQQFTEMLGLILDRIDNRMSRAALSENDSNTVKTGDQHYIALGDSKKMDMASGDIAEHKISVMEAWCNKLHNISELINNQNVSLEVKLATIGFVDIYSDFKSNGLVENDKGGLGPKIDFTLELIFYRLEVNEYLMAKLSTIV